MSAKLRFVLLEAEGDATLEVLDVIAQLLSPRATQTDTATQIPVVDEESRWALTPECERELDEIERAENDGESTT